MRSIAIIVFLVLNSVAVLAGQWPSAITVGACKRVYLKFSISSMAGVVTSFEARSRRAPRL